MKIHIPFSDPPATEPDFTKRLHGEDQGIVNAWLAGIALRGRAEQMAAERGELPPLPFKGGAEPPDPSKPTRKPAKNRKKTGSFWYLAALQGLLGEDLRIDTDLPTTRTCSLTGFEVTFTLDTAKLLKQT